MGRQIDVQDLKKGMYVVELDRPWVETSFMFQGFEIRTDAQLRELQRLCRHVYIAHHDEAGADPGARRKAGPASGAEVVPGGDRRQAEVLAASLTGRRGPSAYGEPIPLETELPEARRLHAEARELFYRIQDDVRLGRNIDGEGLRVIVAGMVDSVVRNPDALVWLTQLRNKDEYTVLHSIRVAILALAFGRHLELTIPELNILGAGALLHDVGKLKIPDVILNKPERLTDEEFAIVKNHVPEGVKILESARRIPLSAIEVAQCHHERYQGGGYNRGLTGERIGLFGLMAAIVDTYDAVTSDRAYHAGISAYDALGKLYGQRNKEYHGGLVDRFIQCLGTYPIGSIVELTTGDIGVVTAINRQRYLRPTVALVRRANGMAFPPGAAVDLAAGHESSASGVEIRRVLPAGAHDIIPADYMPRGPGAAAPRDPGLEGRPHHD
ncbi:HD-GYP domain-containing protein [Acidiferrobacter sp.]|uniref:HD-GYP domain-containing protein n=1 Tax=Acidiferrobacter sp. TaxID=1872107 RepID=UPI0026341489|nr:HD-GYP domain-containing protein [Acidiferrobacter sp.]